MDKNLRGKGVSTASQSAWALMALLAANDHEYLTVIRDGLDYLTNTQRDDGSWDEPYYTGTGFPGYGFGARLDLRDEATKRRRRESLREQSCSEVS
ncbi:MAG: hypothetical protein ACJ0SL_06300 [Candidatus Rariloculaceae bacterium]